MRRMRGVDPFTGIPKCLLSEVLSIFLAHPYCNTCTAEYRLIPCRFLGPNKKPNRNQMLRGFGYVHPSSGPSSTVTFVIDTGGKPCGPVI